MSNHSVGFETRITGTCSTVKYCTKTVFPQSRASHAACQHENWVYVFAGKDGNVTLKDFWRFDLVNQTWEKLTYRGDVPQHLQGHSLLSFKKLLLLFGGEFGDALTESSLWIINPDLGYVRKACLDVKSECPCVRRYQSSVIYQDSMYMYGGYVDVKGSSAEFWRYDIEDEEWELLLPRQHSSHLPGGRYGHTTVIYKQSMWLYGGMNNLVPKQDLWCYSFVSEQWNRIKFKLGPPPLTCHSASVVGSQMVIYGGETNREPVNQVWSFNFSTLKWTQVLFMGREPPSKSFHISLLIKPPMQGQSTIKARSTPYLQGKTKEPVKRPQSSPGYRINSEAIHEDNQKLLVFERTNSAIEMKHQHKETSSVSCSICKNSIEAVYMRSQSLIDGALSIYPSPSESSKDIIPLVSSETDINYNDTYILDKDAVRKGLVNPGVSDSTEKLIEESHSYGIISNGECGNSDSNGAEKRKVCPDCAKTNLLNKKYRMDRDLILEDLEFQDCFPYDIQVPVPANNLISLHQAYRDPDNIETIQLQDYVYRNSDTCNSSCPRVISPDMKHNNTRQFPPHELNNRTVFPTAASLSFSPTNPFRSKTSDALHMNGYQIFQADTSLPKKVDVKNDDNGNGRDCQEMETSFSCPDKLYVNNQCTRIEKKTPVMPLKMDVQERPYLLMIGGKDKNAVYFSVKPISVLKIQLSA